MHPRAGAGWAYSLVVPRPGAGWRDFSVSRLPPRHQQYQRRRTSSYKDFWLIVALQGAKMRQKSGPVKESAEKVVKDIRRATRRHFSAEDKIRIVVAQ